MPKQQRKTRTFTLRFTEEERRRLETEAAGMALGAYIRMQALNGKVEIPRSRGKFPVKDHQALAKALGIQER